MIRHAAPVPGLARRRASRIRQVSMVVDIEQSDEAIIMRSLMPGTRRVPIVTGGRQCGQCAPVHGGIEQFGLLREVAVGRRGQVLLDRGQVVELASDGDVVGVVQAGFGAQYAVALLVLFDVGAPPLAGPPAGARSGSPTSSSRSSRATSGSASTFQQLGEKRVDPGGACCSPLFFRTPLRIPTPADRCVVRFLVDQGESKQCHLA